MTSITVTSPADDTAVPPLSIVFAGSPSAAVPSLRSVASSRHRVSAVLTRDDSEQGRRRVLTPTPIAAEADRLGLPVIRANRLVGPATDEIVALRPDLGVIVAYGGLVREPLLSAPRHGWINLHFSLLPRWRGAAPVQHAIIAGDEVSGCTVFHLVAELDAGDVIARRQHPIGALQTAGQLLDALAEDGAALLLDAIDSIAGGTALPVPQSGTVTLAPKLTLDDARIRWGESAHAVYNRIRAVTPEPGAFTVVDGQRLKVLGAAISRESGMLPIGAIALHYGRLLVGTGSDPIELLRVQPAGKTPMAAGAWWRGRPVGATVVAG